MQRVFRQDIQVLRGLCVISVVLFHFYPNALRSGYLGVDAFFVISGYVLAPQVLNIISSSNQFKEYCIFLRRRFWRLYPAFMAAIVFSLTALFFLARPSIHERAFKQTVYSIFQLGDVGAFKFSGNYFDPSPNPFLHFWSLSVEWQFYLLFPLITVIFLSLLKLYTYKTSIYFAIFIALMSLAFWFFQDFWEAQIITLGLSNYSKGLGYYLSFGRFWQLILGMLAFLCSNKLPSSVTVPVRKSLFFALLATLVFPFPHLIWGSLAISIFTGCLLLLGVNFHNTAQSTIQRYLSWIGFRSYSIYLLHFPLIIILNHNMFIFQVGGIKELTLKATLLVLVLLLGHIMYEYVEKRFRSQDNSLKPFYSKINLTLLSVFLLSIILFYFGFSGNYYSLYKNDLKPQHQAYIGKDCKGNSPSAHPCINREADSQRKVVLLGDSHAEHFSGTFAETAIEKGYNYYGIGFCAPSLDPYPGIREGCLKFSSESAFWIKRIKPDILVVSVYITNSQMASSVTGYLAKLKGTVGRTVILYNSPVFTDGIFVDKPLIYGKQVFPKNVNVTEIDLKQVNLARLFAAKLRGTEIETIDILEIYCGTTTCKRTVDGNWLFIDSNHLSTFGAELLNPIFKKLFDKNYLN